jgi:hypothetical protein
VAAKSQKNAKDREKHKPQNAKTPGKSAAGSNDLGAAASGTAQNRCGVGDVLQGNGNRRGICSRSSRFSQRIAAGWAEMAGGQTAASLTADSLRPLRQHTAAVDTDSIFRVIGDFYTTVSATHNGTSFLVKL